MKVFYIFFINKILSLSIKDYTKLYKYVKHNVIDTSDCRNVETNVETNVEHKNNDWKEYEHSDDTVPKDQEQPKNHQEQPKQPQHHQEQPKQPKQPQHHQEQPKQGGQTSIATFYFRVGPDVNGCIPVQSFDDGNRYGPCRGEDGLSGVQYTSDSKYWAAIAHGGSRCGETITVNYKGKSLQLKVMDECPACSGDNHVDMSLDALIELTGSKEEACSINLPLPMITWY
jgi:hypothetical protein